MEVEDDARAAVPGHTPAPQTPLRQGRGRGNLPSPETLSPCEDFGQTAPGSSRPVTLPALWCGCVSGYCAVAHRPRIAWMEVFLKFVIPAESKPGSREGFFLLMSRAVFRI